MHQIDIGINHPVAIEILSLRDALAQQQHATHQAATQVQKYASEVSLANKNTRQLSAELKTLQAELDILRAPRPISTPSPAEAELTLALRRANSRLEETETQLLEANTSVAHALAERERTSDEVSEAYRLLEAARAQEVELRTGLAERDAEKRVYELALGEYAALVRDMEKHEGEGVVHLDLKNLVAAGEIEQIKELTAEVARAKADIGSLQAQLEAERRSGELERAQLAEVRTLLGKREADDKSAAALVERYMKFSQHHTDVLQRALNDQSTRHSATVTSLSQQIEKLEHALAAESTRTRQLQSSVDTLVEDLARESFGRRREVRVRLATTGRTAKIEEDLRRWERRIREHPRSQGAGQFPELLFGLQELDQFRDIVDLLGAPLIFRDAAISGSEDDALNGPLARILAAEVAVESLAAELEREMTRRIELERERAQLPTAPLLGNLTYDIPPLKAKAPDSSTIPSSASVSITSLRSSSGLSLVTSEASTSVSLEESALSVPTALPTLPIIGLPLAQREVEDPFITATPPIVPPTSAPEPAPASTIPFPSSPSPPPEPVKAPESQSLHDSPEAQALLSQLPTALQRYTPFQNVFRDCHVTLSALKSELRSRPRNHLLIAVERLYDYNEDARVEIEIRVADEARKANGFETMLYLSLANVLDDLRAFVDGSAPDIRKALEMAERKRNELEHDISTIKASVYAPEAQVEVETPASQPPPSPLWGRKMSLGPGFLGTGRPLLRRVASGTLGHGRASSLGGDEHSDLSPKDPLAGLRLKIPMPNMVTSPLPSPMKPNSPLVLERTRVTSMYRVGLGSSRSRLDVANRSMTVTPTSRADEESDDGVE
ncbi:myosin heavy chain [Rhizoctonia solani AG-1 IB]|uniref:Myosin heavy chain n=1 Tax=Thanatephorus cucumeris (strain AG1-IB / isolate 7/3/14) TaxID=1108050 RepID=A0A0B7FFX1_THACB|nr:myosin heavy chain [Rhizoctonia solani AG-1 IB]